MIGEVLTDTVAGAVADTTGVEAGTGVDGVILSEGEDRPTSMGW